MPVEPACFGGVGQVVVYKQTVQVVGVSLSQPGEEEARLPPGHRAGSQNWREALILSLCSVTGLQALYFWELNHVCCSTEKPNPSS